MGRWPVFPGCLLSSTKCQGFGHLVLPKSCSGRKPLSSNHKHSLYTTLSSFLPVAFHSNIAPIPLSSQCWPYALSPLLRGDNVCSPPHELGLPPRYRYEFSLEQQQQLFLFGGYVADWRYKQARRQYATKEKSKVAEFHGKKGSDVSTTPPHTAISTRDSSLWGSYRLN